MRLRTWLWPLRPQLHLSSLQGKGTVGMLSVTRRHTAPVSGGHEIPESIAPDTLVYQPFGDSKSIRILTLLPAGRWSDPLVGRLTVEPLASRPAYETISYVWGVGQRSAKLWIADDYERDAQVLHLTESISEALRRVRLQDRPRRLWVDQVCINQKEVAERSRQVRLMNAIYEGSRRVLVWLGRDYDGVAAEAARMVKHLGGIFKDDVAHEAFHRAHSEDLANQSEEPWIPLSKLTKLPWFTRIWIVQEIGTTTPATLFWGDAELDWDELSVVVGVLNVSYHLLRTRFSIFTPNIRYLYQRFVEPDVEYNENHNRGNFVYELHRARHMRAKDPRDHVYAFLGHFTLRNGPAAITEIEADYSLPLASVYTDLAVRALTGATSLILLSACHGSETNTRANRSNRNRAPPAMPSWVPDFRMRPMHLIGSPETYHRAAGETLPRLHIDEAGRALHITGFRIDVLSPYYFVFYNKSLQMHVAHHHQLALDTIWYEVCGMESYNLEDKYVDGKCSAFFALVQTLTNGCIGVDRTRRYEDVPKEEWLASGAAYLVRNRDAAGDEAQLEDIGPDIREAAQSGNPYKWSHEATLVTRYRCFAVSSKGYYLVGPDAMREGDVIALLYGGRTPFLLRQQGRNWTLVGECYMHGMMNGEAFENKQPDEVFTIV